MRKSIATALLSLLFALTAGTVTHAQTLNSFRMGTFHSPKGFGFCVENIVDPLNFDSLALIADMSGVLVGKHSSPGLKLNYSRNIIYKSIEKDECSIDFYAGPGLTAGHIRDLKSPSSFVAGLHGTAGVLVSYKRNISVSLGLSSDLAFKLINDERKGVILSLYDSGIYKMILPEMRIQYRFK